MLSGSKAERFELFKREFMDLSVNESLLIPLRNYYPTADYRTIVRELSESFPTNFQVSGDNQDFVRQNLIENSYYKRAYSQIVKECIIAKKCFVTPRIIFDSDDKNKNVMVFDFKILPYEKCFDYYDSNGDLNRLLYIDMEEIYSLENEQLITVDILIEYTKDKITKMYRTSSGVRIVGYEDEIVENPFKAFDSMPVFVFDSIEEDGKPIAYDLIEQQLQIESLNFNIENGINYQGLPVWKVKNTFREEAWQDTSIAPNSIVALMGEEDLDQVGGNIQIDALKTYMKYKVDKLYQQAGLTPPTLREEMFGTDSSAVTKLAQAPLISKIKIIMSFHKKPMNELAKLILLLNGEVYKNEKIVPPEEVLPFNLQEVLNTWAIGMNLGLMDDEAFWTKYFPEFTDTDKARIREFFNDRYGGIVENDNTNVTNTAKVAGNKKQATTMTKEERDVNVTK